MFLAGMVPGILVGVALMIYVRIVAQFRDFPTQPRASMAEVVGTAQHGFLALVAPAIILGSIMFGFVTATEAGVLACLYCILLGIWYRELTWAKFFTALSDSAMMTCVIMMIISFSIAMGWLLAIEQAPQKMAEATFALTENKNVFLGLLLIFVIVVGCVVEGVPAKLILVPTLLPVIDAYGIDRVHFGVFLQLGLLIGIATPPMGIGLYIVSEVGRVRFERVTIAVLPMLIPLLAVLVLLTYVPGIVTFLPDLILGPE
jgi:tripartite ATP-independent transporter DctM subunit